MTLFLRKTNDEVSEYLRKNVRGQTAYQISAAILAATKEPLKDHNYRQLQRIKILKSPHTDDDETIDSNRLKFLDEEKDKKIFVNSYGIIVNFLP